VVFVGTVEMATKRHKKKWALNLGTIEISIGTLIRTSERFGLNSKAGFTGNDMKRNGHKPGGKPWGTMISIFLPGSSPT
jgi:hypothetical protein